MQSLQDIKKRIKSVQATSKITGAMKLIATADIRKQSKEYEKIASFCHDFYAVIKPLISSTDEVKVNEGEQKTLYVLISSSLGLCGAFNINITKFLLSKLKADDRIIVIGKKGYTYLKSHGAANKVINTLEVSSKDPSYLEILPVSGIILSLFAQKKFTQVKLVFTKFINSMSFEPAEIKMLPLDKTLFESQKEQPSKKFITSYESINEKDQVIIYESSKSVILHSVLPTFITTLIYAGIIESKLCESGSRRNAMDSATKNAKQLINDLLLKYNRARQEKITQEINEIVAGGAASE